MSKSDVLELPKLLLSIAKREHKSVKTFIVVQENSTIWMLHKKGKRFAGGKAPLMRR